MPARAPRPPTAPRLNPQNVPPLHARKPPRSSAGPFADLTYPQRKAAEAWLYKFCKRWGTDLPQWRRAILIGTAKRLALHPPVANFGYSLRSHAGAKATLHKHGNLNPGIIAMNAAWEWKRAGRPALPSRQLPL